MRLVRLGSPSTPDSLRLAEDDIREPGPGQVLVRIRACSLNYHDAMVIRGIFPTADGRVPVNDGAGEVVALGPGVRGLDIGDMVVSTFCPDWMGGRPEREVRLSIPGETVDGYACEYVCRPQRFFMKAPAGTSYIEAATLPCAGVTAWSALVSHGQIKPGETVLVQGSGGVSIFALQFAKMAGARVIATSSTDAKLEKLKALGADEVINYRTNPHWAEAARDLTDGLGVDHVIEVGGPATMMQSLDACRPGGHIALIGVLTGFAGEISIPAIFSNHIRISGILVGHRAEQQEMIRAIEVNGLKPVIDKVFPLHEIREAFAHYESARHVGKVCLEL